MIPEFSERTYVKQFGRPSLFIFHKWSEFRNVLRIKRVAVTML